MQDFDKFPVERAREFFPQEVKQARAKGRQIHGVIRVWDSSDRTEAELFARQEFGSSAELYEAGRDFHEERSDEWQGRQWLVLSAPGA